MTSDERLAHEQQVERWAELFDRQVFLRSVDLVSAMIGLHVVERGMARHRAGYSDDEVSAYVGELGRYYRDHYAALLATEQAQALDAATARRSADEARLVAAKNLAAMSPLYEDMSSEEMCVMRCVFCEGQEDEMNRVFLHAHDCPWQALADAARTGAGEG